jgi:hypothetical protein
LIALSWKALGAMHVKHTTSRSCFINFMRAIENAWRHLLKDCRSRDSGLQNPPCLITSHVENFFFCHVGVCSPQYQTNFPGIVEFRTLRAKYHYLSLDRCELLRATELICGLMGLNQKSRLWYNTRGRTSASPTI